MKFLQPWTQVQFQKYTKSTCWPQVEEAIDKETGPIKKMIYISYMVNPSKGKHLIG